MTRLRFLDAAGAVSAEIVAAPGMRLLDAAQACGQPLEGTCGGQMACLTCHVVVAAADWAKLARASAEEEDLLDLAPDARRTSRLACQIMLTDALDALEVRLPGGT